VRRSEKMKKIMLSDLKGACKDQRKLFAKVFPDGAPVTLRAAEKAEKAGLDIFWLEGLLKGEVYDAYWAFLKTMRDAYDASRKKPLISALRKMP
jgi:hypothetical protein